MKELLTIARNHGASPDAVSVTESRRRNIALWSFGSPPKTWAKDASAVRGRIAKRSGPWSLVANVSNTRCPWKMWTDKRGVASLFLTCEKNKL